MPTSQVFLCGGQCDAASIVPLSVREAFLRSLPNRTMIGPAAILLAERATDALPETNFTNLLDLEECIAAIVDAVVLIVESAGSMCELGAFAKTNEILHKLLVVVQNAHNNNRSFITLGAIKYIRDNSATAEVHPFDWASAVGGVDVPQYALDGMRTEIESAIGKIDRQPRFDRKSVGHRIFLTLAFCHLLRGAKLIEIKECFSSAKISDVSEKDIRKYLDTLQICRLVERAANGAKHVHYISLVEQLPLRVAFTEDTPNKDRNILRWISEIVSDIASEDPVRIKMFQAHNHAA